MPFPLQEILVVRRTSDPPLHRWDDSFSRGELSQNRWMSNESVSSSARSPRKPERKLGTQDSTRFHTSSQSNNQPPRVPQRSSSTEQMPPFLNPEPAMPSARKTSKKSSHGNNDDVLDIPNIALEPITLHGTNEVTTGIAKVLEQVVSSSGGVDENKNSAHSAHDVTVMFAIRRPGCGQCREHAIQLSQLLQNKTKVKMLGVIKETGINDEAIQEFYTKYFSFPLYKDSKWSLFKDALGDKKLSIWKIIRTAPRLSSRLSRKGIQKIPFGGDLYTKGGVLIFDKQGNLRFVYYERYGDEFDLQALNWAIEEARKPLPVHDSNLIATDESSDLQ